MDLAKERKRLLDRKRRGKLSPEEKRRLEAMPRPARGRPPASATATAAPAAAPAATPAPDTVGAATAAPPASGDELPPVDFAPPEREPKAEAPPNPKRAALAKTASDIYVSFLRGASRYVHEKGGLGIPEIEGFDLYSLIGGAAERLALQYIPEGTDLALADEAIVAGSGAAIFGQAAYFSLKKGPPAPVMPSNPGAPPEQPREAEAPRNGAAAKPAPLGSLGALVGASVQQ